MTPSQFVLFAALLAAAPVATAAYCNPTAMTDINVTRAGDAALATYQFGEAISCLALGERGDVRKMTWQLETPGAVLSEDGNTVQFARPSTVLTVRLQPFDHDGAIDRAYSPVIAFGDHTAVAVYTDYLYPKGTGHGVAMSFNGFAPTAPQRPVGPQRLGIEQTYMIIGEPVIVRRGAVAAIVDQAMPSWLLSQVNGAIARGEAALQGVTSTPGPLTYLMTHTEPGTPDASWRGDTRDRLVRLNFMGARWQTGDVANKDAIDTFILHELFHTASGPKLDPRLPGALSLNEGGAEAGARAMQRHFAPADSAGPGADVDNAIASCTEMTGTTLADKEQKSQRSAPYACGMALQFMVAAAVQRDPLAIWQAMLRGAKPFGAGWPDFLAAAAAAAAGKPNPDALATLDALTASRVTWSTGIDQLTSLGVLRRRSETELAQSAYGHRYRTAAIFHLLKETCRQRYGFNTDAGVYILDAPPGTSCVAPDKFRLVTMNGIDLTRDAYRAYHELARRCAAQVPVRLKDDEGHTIELACKTAPPTVTLFTLAS